jgi:hypothetical protein
MMIKDWDELREHDDQRKSTALNSILFDDKIDMGVMREI